MSNTPTCPHAGIVEALGVNSARTLRAEKTDSGDIEIRYGQMYETPSIEFVSASVKLKEFYGASDVRLDGYSFSGCKTCDWGSDYGHEILVIGPTKNIEAVGDWSTR